MMDKRLTILIPTYNRGNLIRKTIESCFLQTYKDFKILIYDDVSTDDTQDVISTLSKKYPNQITCVKGNKNMGIGYARNFLIKALNTELGMWLDSDDLMTADRAEKCVSYLDKNPDVEIVYSNIQWFTEAEEIKLRDHIKINVSTYDKNIWTSLKFNTTCASGFFRNSLQKYTFEESLKLGGEDVLWIWKLLQNNVKIGHINESLYLYRDHQLRIGKQKRHESMRSLKVKEETILAEKIKEIQNANS